MIVIRSLCEVSVVSVYLLKRFGGTILRACRAGAVRGWSVWNGRESVNFVWWRNRDGGHLRFAVWGRKQYAGVLGDVDVNDSNFENERIIAFSTGDASLAKTRCSGTTSENGRWAIACGADSRFCECWTNPNWLFRFWLHRNWRSLFLCVMFIGINKDYGYTTWAKRVLWRIVSRLRWGLVRNRVIPLACFGFLLSICVPMLVLRFVR